MAYKKEWWWGIFLVALALVVRPFWWHVELMGNFSSYQVVFAMIAERYCDTTFEHLFRPELFLIENAKPALELIFLPLVSIFAAMFKILLGGSLDMWGRFTSIAASLFNAFLLYHFGKKTMSKQMGLFAAFFFLFSPFVLVYGRNFQNEALATLFFSGAFFLMLNEDKQKKNAWCFVAAFSAGMAITMRLHYLVLLPVFWAIAPPTSRQGFRLTFWIGFGLLLPLMWHLHAYGLQQELNYVHTTLFMQGQAGKTFPHPYLIQPVFYWHLLKDLGFWTVGPVGFLLVFLGLRKSPQHRVFKRVMCIFVFVCMLIAVLIPKKYVDQHFYIYPIVVPLSLMAAFGLVRLSRKISKVVLIALLTLSFLLSLRIAWDPAFYQPASDCAITQVAAFIKTHTPEGARIIAAHGSSGDLLYYSDRLGWGFSINPHIKQEISVYMKMRGINGISDQQWHHRNTAYMNSIAWLNYLREGGAQYFFSSTSEELNKNPELLIYLKTHFKQLTTSDDPFYGFKLVE